MQVGMRQRVPTFSKPHISPLIPMSAFSSYRILHVPILEAVHLMPEPNSYVVLWWQKIPLGHLWIDAENTPKSSDDLRLQLLAAVSPALDFYFSENHTKEDWKEAVKIGKVDTLRELLQSDPVL